MTEKIYGPRVHLRPTSEEEHSKIRDWLADPAYRQGYIGTDADLGQWIADYESLAPDMRHAVLLSAITNDTGELVAFVSAKPNFPLPWIWDADILANPRFPGQGLGREAFALGLRYIFSGDKAHKVAGPVAADNVASLKLVEWLGFTREGTLRAQLLRSDGSAHDAHLYGLLRSEWVDPYLPAEVTTA